MISGLALCAGVGGLELGLKLALGEKYECVGYCEREAYSASDLVARMAEKAMDKAPTWDDITSYPGEIYGGKVDIVTAGFPCQPWSTAGHRKGTKDDRWIWPALASVIRKIRPSFAFLENVPGLARGGLWHVVGDLASLGLDCQWCCFSAAEVGASHRRTRLFILAYPSSESIERAQGQFSEWKGLKGGSHELANPRCDDKRGTQHELGPGGKSADIEDSVREVANSKSGRRGQEGELRPKQPSKRTTRSGKQMADPQGDGRGQGSPCGIWRESQVSVGGVKKMVHTTGQGLAIGRHGKSRETFPDTFPPGPEDESAWKAWIKAHGPKPAIRRGSYGLPDRVDRLRALGNSVVPLVAAHAFRTLAIRAGLIE